MKKLYLMLMMLTIMLSLNAQNTFHKYYSINNSVGILYRCIQTSDAGYAAIGHVTNVGTFEDDFLMVKTDLNGDATWIKRITGPGSDDLSDLAETASGNLVVAGSSMNLASFLSQAIVEKFDIYGNRLWCKTFSISGGSAIAKRILPAESDDVYVLGSIDMPMASSDYFIMKLDENGNIINQWTIGTPESDVPLSFVRLPGGDFVISGWHNSGSGENIHLIRVNPMMIESWNTLIVGGGNLFCYDLAVKANGNILLAGRGDDGMSASRPVIAEIDASNGQQVWAKNYYSETGLASSLYGIAIYGDDLIGVSGVIEDTAASTLVFATDGSGNIAWTNRAGTSSTGEYASGYGICTTYWNGFVVCGPRSGGNSSVAHMMSLTQTGEASCSSSEYPMSAIPMYLPFSSLTLTTHNGTLIAQNASYTEAVSSQSGGICLPAGITPVPEATSGLLVYPNPSTGKFAVSISKPLQNGTLSIYNSMGWVVYQVSGLTSQGTITHNLNLHLSAGIYWIQLTSGNSRMAEKVVISEQ